MTKPPARIPVACHFTSPSVVRDRIARAVIDGPTRRPRRMVAGTIGSGEENATLGSLTLLPHQLDAVTRVRAILRELHVALLADDVGLGKTYVALALARDYRHVRIVAPAALLPMWRTALARAQCTHAVLESLQRYSRASQPPAALHTGALVIIDEAHHLRTPTTRRYRTVAESVAGCDVLLLSATPVHNKPGDLRALLALALGARAGRLSDALLSRLVVRRTHLDGRPRIAERPPLTVPHDPAVLDAILALPAPLPAHDGAVAGALIRLGLLRAWCSSDAALARSLRQRLLRGEALRQALEAGRHPTNAELRSWLVGEHEVQLAFPELLAGHAPAAGPLLEVLDRHLDAVRMLLHDHQQSARGDSARAHALRAILAAHPGVPVVAFSQFAATVRAIGRALSDIAGVGALTGQRAWIASGSISRHDALAHFAPVAQGRPPPPPHQRIRLLLATDLLAEGVNLQDAGVVVHLDLPWTDALRRQRVGRCVRVGSPHEVVTVYRIEPPQGAEAVLRLHARLARKARWSARLVGATPDAVTAAATTRGSAADDAATRGSAADDATTVRTLLTSWMRHDPPASAQTNDIAPPGPRRSAQPLVCTVSSALHGFVGVVATADGTVALVGGRRLHDANGDARWWLSTSPRRLLPLLRAAAFNSAGSSSVAASWPRASRALRRWLARRARAVDLGDAEAASSQAHRRMHAALLQAMTRLPPMRRVGLRDEYRRASILLARARGVAAEHALGHWLRSIDCMPVADWLRHGRTYPALAATGDEPMPMPMPVPVPVPVPTRLLAVLLLEPTAEGARPASFRA